MYKLSHTVWCFRATSSSTARTSATNALSRGTRITASERILVGIHDRYTHHKPDAPDQESMYEDLAAMRVGVLFSGGKDSTYACYRAMEAEEVVCLITVTPHNPDSYMFHTPNVHLTGLQAEAIGLPLVSVTSEGVKEEELADLRRAMIRAVEEHGVEGIVSGAILSVYQATRVQRLCHELGLWCFNPLWYTDQDEYLNHLLTNGFKAIITGVFAAPFDEQWLGRTIDTTTISLLKRISHSHGITLTGEGGEFETFVADAPIFRKRIEILQAHTTYRAHHGRYLVERVRLVPK